MESFKAPHYRKGSEASSLFPKPQLSWHAQFNAHTPTRGIHVHAGSMCARVCSRSHRAARAHMHTHTEKALKFPGAFIIEVQCLELKFLFFVCDSAVWDFSFFFERSLSLPSFFCFFFSIWKSAYIGFQKQVCSYLLDWAVASFSWSACSHIFTHPLWPPRPAPQGARRRAWPVLCAFGSYDQYWKRSGMAWKRNLQVIVHFILPELVVLLGGRVFSGDCGTLQLKAGALRPWTQFARSVCFPGQKGPCCWHARTPARMRRKHTSTLQGFPASSEPVSFATEAQAKDHSFVGLVYRCGVAKGLATRAGVTSQLSWTDAWTCASIVLPSAQVHQPGLPPDGS